MRLLFLSIVLLLIAIPAAAGEDGDAYRLHIGDQLRFQVWDNVDLNLTTDVLSDGSVTFPLVGRLMVEGLTLAEVENLCRIELEIYLINPIVNVMVTQAYVPRVKIIGRIQGAGKYIIYPGDTLLDIIGYAGGFSSRCDVRNILILSKSGSRIVDLKYVLTGEEQLPEEELALQDGDFIIIPEVNRPNWDKASTYVNGVIQGLLLVAR